MPFTQSLRSWASGAGAGNSAQHWGVLRTPSCPCRGAKAFTTPGISPSPGIKSLCPHHLPGSAPTCPLPGDKPHPAPRFCPALGIAPPATPGALPLLQPFLGNSPLSPADTHGIQTCGTLSGLALKDTGGIGYAEQSTAPYPPSCGDPFSLAPRETELIRRGAAGSWGRQPGVPAGGPPQPVCSGTS